MTAARGGWDPLRKMLAHYRMLRFLRRGRWRSVKATIRTFWNLYVGGRNLGRVRYISSTDHGCGKRRACIRPLIFLGSARAGLGALRRRTLRR
jgi:hypothetical protein